MHVIALYGEEFDVFPESFGGWESFFFFFLTSHYILLIQYLKEQDFFFFKSKI